MLQRALIGILLLTLMLGIMLPGSGVEQSDQPKMPDVLPDGSKLQSVKDLFKEVMTRESIQRLREYFPHVIGGKEYHYALYINSRAQSEWGILVFNFDSKETALDDFQYFANKYAFANKNPKFISEPNAANVPEIKRFFESAIPNVCIMDEIIVLVLDRYVIWVDDYQLSASLKGNREFIWNNDYRRSIDKAIKIGETIYFAGQEKQIGPVPPSIREEPITPPVEGLGSIRIMVTNHKGEVINNFHLDRTKLPFFQWSKEINIRKQDDSFAGVGKWELQSFPPRPVAPQDFHSYYKVIPNVWCEIIYLDSVNKESVTYSLPENSSEMVISDLRPGRYMVRCGTTIQVDEEGIIDTGVPFIPSQTARALPPVPLIEEDEKGLWETFRLKSIESQFVKTTTGYGEHYIYRILKRYTYNIVASTLTYIEAGAEDNAYIPLVTDPDILGKLSASIEHVKVMKEFDLKKEITNSIVEEIFSTGLEEIFKKTLPKASRVRAAGMGPGLLAGEIANLIYLGIMEPSTELDEEFLVRFGAGIGVSALSIKISTAVGAAAGGPVGMAAGFTVGVIASTMVDKIIDEYNKGQVREKAAEAFFDDISVILERDKSNIVTEVKMRCRGLMVADPYIGVYIKSYLLNVTKSPLLGVCYSCAPEMPWISFKISPYYQAIGTLQYNRECKKLPLGYWESGTAVLVADVPIVYGSSEYLEDLTWCLNDLIVEFEKRLEIDITVDKSSYWVGEGALITMSFNKPVKVTLVDHLPNGSSKIVFKDRKYDAGSHSSTAQITSEGGVGQETLELIAYDAQGNKAVDSVTFSVRKKPTPKPEMPASSTVLVVDVSGSMNWQDPTGKIKLDAAKDAAQRFINMFADENETSGVSHQLGVVTFSSSASLRLSLTTDPDQARKIVSNLGAGGGTNMAQGLSIANKELKNAKPESKRIIILLSDGVPTVSMSGETGKDPEALKREVLLGPVAEAALRGYCIHVVGFGKPGEKRGDWLSIDPAFLTTIALATGCGRYYTAADADQLANIYVALRHESLGKLLKRVSGQVRQGEIVDIGKITVPSNQEELHFTVSWPGSRLDPILIDPHGQAVDDNYPGAAIAIHPNLAHVIVLDPLPGDWYARVVGSEVAGGATSFDAALSIRGKPASDIGELLGRLIWLLIVILAAVLISRFSGQL